MISFNLSWTDSVTGNRVIMENMSSKFLVNYILRLGKDCIDPEIYECPNRQYLGEPK